MDATLIDRWQERTDGTCLRHTSHFTDVWAIVAVLAIGNEGHGLSAEMLEAADRVVRIPMEPGAESLNAGAAAAVLLWEVYRRRRA